MSEMRKLMEAVEQLNEEYVEYRDPDGEFQVIYDFPRGYFAVGKNDAKQDISGESFDNLDDAIEHAEICLSIGNDEYEDQFVDEQIDEISGDGEPDLALKIANIIMPQIEDDGNSEEWIQLMIYAFEDLDMEFNVDVANQIFADYGMKPHCDLQARFGSFDESVIEEDRFVESASGTQWETAINNLIGEGDGLWRERDASPAQIVVWDWVSQELHGMLDFQPEPPSFNPNNPNDPNVPVFLRRQAD